MILAIALVLSQVLFTLAQNATITENIFPDPVQELIFPGDDARLVFVLTTYGELYRSTNGGESFESVMPKLQGSNETSVAFVLPSPADKTGQHVFLVSETNINWLTQDGGETWTFYNSTVNIEEVDMHPTLPNVFVVRELTQECYSFDPADLVKCYDQVFITEDFGASFELLENYVFKLLWGPTGVDEGGDITLVISSYTNQTGYQFQRDITEQTLWRFSKNPNGGERARAGFSKQSLLENTFGFVYLPRFVFAVSKNTSSTDRFPQMLLWASEAGGLNMRQATFPEQLNVNSQITIVDATDVMIMTLYLGQPFSDLYVSDADGLVYTSVVERVRRVSAHVYDFYNPKGVDGIFFVNQNDASGDSRAFRTLITTDKGGIWNSLQGPAESFEGEQRNCSIASECQLHFSFDSVYRPVTSERAVGMLLAHGNVGPLAAVRVSTWRPFVSRDNGVTWSETVSPDVYHATIGFHGAIIVLVSHSRATSDMLFTLDEGQNWVEQKDAWPLMAVEEVYHHNALETQDFLVQGYRTVNRTRNGIVAHVDFASLNVRDCQGIQNPGEVTSDYEFYTPSTTAAGCLLGRVVKYVRRKQSAVCVDKVDHSEKIVQQTCECTRADYECDYGYKVNPSTRECQRDPRRPPLSPEEQCAFVGAEFYYESTGYRLIPGDQCEGGLQRDRVRKACGTFTLPPTPVPLTPSPTPSPTPNPTTTTLSTPSPADCGAQGSTCQGASDCCGEQRCINQQCGTCPDVQACAAGCVTTMTFDSNGCPLNACDCSTSPAPPTATITVPSAPISSGPTVPDVQSPSGLGGGIIALIVLLVLLLLGLACGAAYVIRKRRNSYEVHGTGEAGNTSRPVSEMELDSESSE